MEVLNLIRLFWRWVFPLRTSILGTWNVCWLLLQSYLAAGKLKPQIPAKSLTLKLYRARSVGLGEAKGENYTNPTPYIVGIYWVYPLLKAFLVGETAIGYHPKGTSIFPMMDIHGFLQGLLPILYWMIEWWDIDRFMTSREWIHIPPNGKRKIIFKIADW